MLIAYKTPDISNFCHGVFFWQAVHVIIKNGGSAPRGDAKGAKLGEKGLPLNSVEGSVANVIYGKHCGDSVFQRISPIAHILIGSGVCADKRGDLEIHKKSTSE